MPALDCKCGHPDQLHAQDGAGWCREPACPCTKFAASEAKPHLRCYLCDRPAHATGRCPYVARYGPSR